MSASPIPAIDRCPYLSCPHTLAKADLATCACEVQCPIARCPVCSIANRVDARFCRACQTSLSPARPASRIAASPVGFIQAPGDFYYPPLVHAGFLWCLSATGAVTRISPRSGAKPVTLHTLSTGQGVTGFNRFAVFDAADADPPFRGPLLVAAEPGGVYGMSLLTGATGVLFRPASREEMVANSSAEESIYFRGLTVSPDMFCFLTRTPGSGQARLIVRYFHPQRAGEDTITVPGSDFLAPVISGDFVAVCSDQEISVYGLTGQTHLSFRLPRNFRPFFKRPSQANIPLGSLPFAVAQTDDGLTAFVAGLEDGRPGLLRARIDRQFAEFEVFASGCCVSNALPEGLTINRGGTVDFLAAPRPPIRLGDLQPGMPIGYEPPYLACFNQSELPGKHRLTVFSGMPVEFDFDDPLCNEDTCCSISFCDTALVVSYMIPAVAGSARGLRMAHCRLST